MPPPGNAPISSAALSVSQALRLVLAGAAPLAGEDVELAEAQDRILVSSLSAKLTQPPFDASAMDGYAVRKSDLAGTSAPLRLDVIGQSAAGHGFHGTLGSGQAVRIFTGAPMPEGADRVIIQEHTTLETHGSGECSGEGSGPHHTAPPYGVVTITDPRADSGHIRARGFDFAEGDALIGAHRKLGARELSLAAAMGHGTVHVRRCPRVAILSTGDELVPPGTVPGPGQIVSSNHLGVAALVRMAGAEPILLGIARDTMDSLNEHIRRAAAADILVTIGGASVGDHDLVGPVLRARGMELAFWKIAMRPGKPLMFGTLQAQRVLGLPGNPVSSLVCARVFLVPLIGALLGRPEQPDATQQLELGSPLEANGPRQHYMRATMAQGPDGKATVAPVRSQDSSLLSAFAAADCLIVRPPNAAAAQAGEMVDVLALDF